jgi:phosphoglycolate phosphatase-like HAD superfamily hydrolase
MNRVLVLDFDGVLCDSARETAATAWRAGSQIWPAWSGEIPAGHTERFCEVRPWLETGYQAILMMRMVDLGCDDTAFSEHLSEWEGRILAECGCSKEALVTLFGGTRDRWIGDDLPSWLSANGFFAGTVARVKEWLASGGELYVATTKQERFVCELLASQGVELAADRLYGLERGIKKEQLLQELAQRYPGHSLHFVEDRLDTLRRVEAISALDGVLLYLALWGYCTPADRESAALDDRITCWPLEGFLWK